MLILSSKWKCRDFNARYCTGFYSRSFPYRMRVQVEAENDNISNIMFYRADLPINDELIDIYGVIGQSKIGFMS